jgi:hypothetical protein
MKGAVSVSNPFDVMSTVINLKYRFFGIYDMFIRESLAKPFIDKKFKTPDYGDDWHKELK